MTAVSMGLSRGSQRGWRPAMALSQLWKPARHGHGTLVRWHHQQVVTVWRDPRAPALQAGCFKAVLVAWSHTVGLGEADVG